MCTVISSRNNLDTLLRGFLAGDHVAREKLPRVAERYVLKIARRLGPDLPDDLHYDVVNQAFLNLMLQKPASYNPARGAAGTFLKLMVRNALRQVRASNAPPGHVTRVRKLRGTALPVSAPSPIVVSLDELDEDNMPTSDRAIATIEARYDVEALLRRAPAELAVILSRVYLQGETVGYVASDVGVSRYIVSRQISEHMQEVRTAA